MSEGEQMYEFNTDYDNDSTIDSKQSIPPISTFAKGTNNGGGGASEGYPASLYDSKDNTGPMANIESNNNDSSNTDSSSESMSVASPSQQQKQSQQSQETQQQPTQHQQLLQQPHGYGFQYSNQVLVSSTSPETNGVLASQVIHSGGPGMLPGAMSLQGHTVIPFMTPSSSAPPATQGMIQAGGPPEQMVQYSSSALHLTSAPQSVYSMPTPVQANASVIHVNDTLPVQPTILPHNIDLQQHLQQQQQPHKNNSADDKVDQDDDSRKVSLATLVPHAQMQPPIQSGANPRPGLPPHLMQLNPPAPQGPPVPHHFIPGSGPGPGHIPIQGAMPPGGYGNGQVLPPQQHQQGPTSVVCMPPHIGQPPHGMMEQPNPMIGAGPGPGAMGMPNGSEEEQQSPGSSANARRNIKRRGNKRDVPVEEKDARYFERRDRNNKAAKRSRDARKIREEQVGMRAHYLEKENDFLRAQLNTLREEATSLKLLLAQRPPINQMPPSGQPPPMQ